MITKEGYPAKNELVICTVKRLLPHCAFVSIDEYDNKEGMLHISEVSLKGVKDIKDHLSVNKKLVCKVLSVNEAKGHVDLTLKRVKQSEMTRKLNEARLEKRVYKMIDYSCSKNKFNTKNVISELLNNYDSLAEFYEDLRSKGVGVIESLKLPPKVAGSLKDQFNEMLEQTKVSVTKTLTVSSDESDGLLRIKELLSSLNKTKDYEVAVSYVSAPKYLMTVKARNYKVAEQAFTELYDSIQSRAKQSMIKVGLIG